MQLKQRIGEGNRTGYQGVKRTGSSSFTASVTVDGVQRYLGTFATAEEASAVYEAAKRELHGPGG